MSDTEVWTGDGARRGLRYLEQRLTPRDLDILRSIERFRLLSSGLVRRLHFPTSPHGNHASELAATRAALRVLPRLESLGVVARLARRVGGPLRGSSAAVWQLSATGERYLRALRGDPDRRKFAEPGTGFVAHTLAVADIAVGLIERSRLDGFEVLELQTEPACWRTFAGTGAGTVTVKPDLLVVAADDATETHSFVEVDRATEHLPAVLRKCAVYQRHYLDGSEQQARGLYPAVVWVVPSEPRARGIRSAVADDPSLDERIFAVVTADGATAALAPYGIHQTELSKGGTP